MVTVKMYMTPKCEWCKKAKQWFKKKKIKVEELDIVEPQHQPLRDEILHKTGQFITPTFDIDGKIIVGFDEEELEKALA